MLINLSNSFTEVFFYDLIHRKTLLRKKKHVNFRIRIDLVYKYHRSRFAVLPTHTTNNHATIEELRGTGLRVFKWTPQVTTRHLLEDKQIRHW